jgi:hypothetical protein
MGLIMSFCRRFYSGRNGKVCRQSESQSGGRWVNRDQSTARYLPPPAQSGSIVSNRWACREGVARAWSSRKRVARPLAEESPAALARARALFGSRSYVWCRAWCARGPSFPISALPCSFSLWRWALWSQLESGNIFVSGSTIRISNSGE